MKKIARGFTLRPQAIFAAAEEGDLLFCYRLLECFLIHESQHEDDVCAGVLNNAGDQPIEFGEIYFVGFNHWFCISIMLWSGNTYARISMPLCFKYRFKSGIFTSPK